MPSYGTVGIPTADIISCESATHNNSIRSPCHHIHMLFFVLSSSFLFRTARSPPPRLLLFTIASHHTTHHHTHDGELRYQRNSVQRDASRTTVRLLNSLIRLAQAHARLMARHEATVEDAVMAIVMVESR